MTAPDSPAPTTPVDQIRKALLGYRVLAWATGLWLIALCYEMVMKYGFNDDSLGWIAVVHKYKEIRSRPEVVAVGMRSFA